VASNLTSLSQMRPPGRWRREEWVMRRMLRALVAAAFAVALPLVVVETLPVGSAPAVVDGGGDNHCC